MSQKIYQHTTETFIQTVKLNHGDKYSFEKSTYVGSNKNIIVTCTKHNCDINIKAETLLRKTIINGGLKKNPIVGSCPECRKEYFAEIKKQMFEKFRRIHNNEYDYDEDGYVNSTTYFNAICKIHGKFRVLGERHSEGHGKCPTCYPHRRELSLNHKIVDGKSYYVCIIHGDIPMGKYRSLSSGCPKCSEEKQKIINTEILKNRLNKKYQDYDITVDDINVTFICKKHCTKIILTRKELHNKKDITYFCKLCLNEYNQNVVDIAKKNAITNIKQIINDEYSNIYEYLEFIDNSNIKKCKIKLLNKLINKEKIVLIESILKHKLAKDTRYVLRNYLSYEEAKNKVRNLGITSFREYKKWYIRTQQTELPTNPQRNYKEWTSYCDFFGTNPKSHMSWGEKKIDEHLKRKNIEFIWQKRFKNCRDKMPLPFDFYVPEYNLIIEFDGEQHYKKTSKFGKDSFESTQKHDKIKNEYCKNNNIHILRLTYNELINNVLEWAIDNELREIFVNKLLKI
jgi:very-short-patch-repair endonuclease